MNGEELKKGFVYYNNIFAGVIYEDVDGYVFKYDDEYVKSSNPPISLTLPLTTNEYHSSILFPFFDGLIPEGWLLKIALEQYDLKKRDRFKLLLLACEDCIGAVSIKRSKKDD